VSRLRVAIVGAAGYGGGELASILLRHPRAEVVAAFGSSRRAGAEKPARLGDLHPRLRGLLDLEVVAAEAGAIAAARPDAIFLATPHEASEEMLPGLLGVTNSRSEPTRVFDLSGAFRLRQEDYPGHYGFPHHHPELLKRAVYGLPELHRARIAGADFVAVPGCYPTSAILPLAPLVKAGAVRPGTRPIIDSTSGVSGAGRTPSAKVHFCEVSLQPYNVLKHRHNPEIDLYCGTPTVFTPHLGAFDRGILSTIHVELSPGWTGEHAGATLREAYGRESFVRLLPAGEWPSVGAVRGTNFCDIAWAADDAHSHLIVVSALDNLVKGAAGQAVQCMNIRFGLPETMGLLPGSDTA
jgi:N-acetyl-gamma-glutamyl-phosphate reductase